MAAISDIHGNLPALEAVLAEIADEHFDLVVCCGDVASGPMPAETIERLMELDKVEFVRGNADRGLVDEFDGKPKAPMSGPFADWCARQITRRHRDFLDSFQTSITLDGVDGLGRVMFCHATPRNDTDVVSVESPDERMRTVLQGVEADVVVCGHTHMQFDRRAGRIRVVNAGSVGMPNGEPGAYWAGLGPALQLRRTDYDRSGAAERIRAKDWELADRFAAENVLTVPSVEEALAVMRRLEQEQTAPES